MLRLRHYFLILLLSASCVCYAKPAELTPKEMKKKAEEIFRAHVSYKIFNGTVAKRTLQNFLLELDPFKTYFLENEVVKWDNPSEELLEQVVSQYNDDSFQTFEEIHKAMVVAIERRNILEEEISLLPTVKGLNSKELKNNPWAKSRDELKERLIKIRSLQHESAENLDPKTKDLLFQKLTKYRLSHEAEIQGIEKKIEKTSVVDRLFKTVNSFTARLLKKEPSGAAPAAAPTKEVENQILTLVLKAICTSMDNHTVYFTPTEASQFAIDVQKRLFGIGALLRDDLNGFTIIRMIEGSPAILSNKLRVGDKIIAVNSEPVVGMDITDAVHLIRGPQGSPVNLTIMRENERIDYEVTRDEIVLKETRFDSHVEPYGDGVIAHLRLYSFYQDPNSSSTEDIKGALAAIQAEHSLKGVILDLRSNGGGMLTEAVSMAGLFMKKGIVVSVKDSMGTIKHLRNFNGTPSWEGPLLILTDRASASAAEIVAQTLQDYGRAFLVGDDHTYGKGSYQSFTLESSEQQKVNPKGEFKVTRGLYYTVSGKTPQLNGAAADVVVPGFYCRSEIGEKHSLFPLEADQIDPHFIDNLEDIHVLNRAKLKRFYMTDLQQKEETYTPYLTTLAANSAIRLKTNPNYVKFLEALEKEESIAQGTYPFGQNDLQLEEGVNVMKDLLFLMGKPATKEIEK